MTIYGMDYRPAPYEPIAGWRRLWPLVHLEFSALFRSRWGIALYVACLFPSIVRLVFVLIWSGVFATGMRGRMPGNRPQQFDWFVPDNPAFYLEQVVASESGLVPLLVLTALTTSRAIAKDRTTNALELYWTRGITPYGYLLGKWAGSFALVATVTVVAPLVLWLTAVLFAEDWSFLADTGPFMPGVLAGLLCFTFALTSICLLFSAIAGTPNLAMILWALLLGLSTAVANIAAEALRDAGAASWLSVFESAGAVARAVAGQPQRGAPVLSSVLTLAVVGGGLALLARRRLRLQEAIG